MTGEFRNKPRSDDWVLPEEVRESMDDIDAAVLSEHALDDVPIPLGFKISIEFTDYFKKLDAGEETAQSVREIVEQRTAEEQERYPDSIVWDRSRAFSVDMFIERGYEDEAFELVWTISSPQALVAKLMDLNDVTQARLWPEILSRIYELDEVRRRQTIRAFRDSVIDNDPFNEALDVFNDYLRKAGIEADPVEGWVDSQREANPQYPWDTVVEFVKNEDLWEGVPIPFRQHMILIGMELSQEIASTDELSELWAAEAVDYLDGVEDEYPEATIWGNLRCDLSLILLTKDVAQSLFLGSSVRDPKLAASLALEFIEKGQEEAAIELAILNTDPHLTADLLLNTAWKLDERAPVNKFIEIIEGNEYPITQRIGCLEVVRDRFVVANDLDKAERYQEKIDKLKKAN